VLKNFLLTNLVNLAKLLRRRNSNTHFERFLIVSTTGLGDTLWATPAIRALRTRHPSAYIGVLTSKMGASVLKGNPYIDETFILGDPALPSLFSLYRTIKSRCIDTALIFHVSQRPIIPFCHLIGAKEVIGTENLCKGLDTLLTKRLPLKYEHEILRRLAIVEQTGAKPQGLAMEMYLQNKDHSYIQHFLRQRNVPDYIPIIGLHPGAKDLFKQWHPDGFIAVGKRLTEEHGCQIIVTGNADEKDLVCKIADNIPRAIPIYGQLNIHQLAALQKKMRLLITNDTGPMHLAAAVGTPILAIFGPTDPSLCGPIFASSYEIIALKPTCTPCLKKRCREPFCLLQITSDHIFQKALSFLRN
jgi:ADP-heptose:LPS heptosyltransferase